MSISSKHFFLFYYLGRTHGGFHSLVTEDANVMKAQTQVALGEFAVVLCVIS